MLLDKPPNAYSASTKPLSVQRIIPIGGLSPSSLTSIREGQEEEALKRPGQCGLRYEPLGGDSKHDVARFHWQLHVGDGKPRASGAF